MIGKCWYCSRESAELTDEHVLSEANFGSRLVSPSAVCGPCNSDVGKLERRIAGRSPLAEYVARDSLLYAKRPNQPEAEGRMESGARARVKYHADGVRPVHVFRDDGAPPVEDRVSEMHFGIGPGNIDDWPRFGAKVALALASLVFDHTWLLTPNAVALQGVLARRPWEQAAFAYQPDFAPTVELGADQPLSRLAPGEHAVGLAEFEDGPAAWMVLFGALPYRVSMRGAVIPPSQPTWLLKPRAAAECVPQAELLSRLSG